MSFAEQTLQIVLIAVGILITMLALLVGSIWVELLLKIRELQKKDHHES